jgi:hypothetical protein
MAQGTFKTVAENVPTVRRWLHAVEAVPFMDAMEEWHNQEVHILKSARDPVDISRAQGKLEVLDKIINWRKGL